MSTAVVYSLSRAQELLFVFGLDWGVVGAALAPAIGQYVGLAVMVGLLPIRWAVYLHGWGLVFACRIISDLMSQQHRRCLWT